MEELVGEEFGQGFDRVGFMEDIRAVDVDRLESGGPCAVDVVAGAVAAVKDSGWGHAEAVRRLHEDLRAGFHAPGLGGCQDECDVGRQGRCCHKALQAIVPVAHDGDGDVALARSFQERYDVGEDVPGIGRGEAFVEIGVECIEVYAEFVENTRIVECRFHQVSPPGELRIVGLIEWRGRGLWRHRGLPGIQEALMDVIGFDVHVVGTGHVAVDMADRWRGLQDSACGVQGDGVEGAFRWGSGSKHWNRAFTIMGC